MGEESLESFRARLFGASISTYAVIMFVVPLKMYCRVRSGGLRNLKWDDALTVATLIFANCFHWLSIIALYPQLGRHIADIMVLPDGIDQVNHFLRWIFVGQIMYTFSISFSKFTILAFYWRLFSVKVRLPIYIMTFLVFGWLVSICFAVVFTCDPVAGSWDVTVAATAKCHSLKQIYLGGSIPNILMDVILVLMPLPYVWRLQAPVSQRLLLASLFMLGIFISIVSMIRLSIFMKIPFDEAQDMTFHFREIIIWSCVEINVGLTCACLPSLKPALSLFGLNRLFSFADSRALTPGPSQDFHGWKHASETISGSSKKPRKKGATGGLFSTLAGISRIEEDDDEFQLTDKRVHGESAAEITVARSSESSKESREKIQNGMSGPKDWNINVKKDWSVRVNNDGRADR